MVLDRPIVERQTFAMMLDDEHFMVLAMEVGAAAAEHGDVPVGAVLVDERGVVLAKAANQRELRGDPTAHAELEVLRQPVRPGWRRDGTTLYVTLEPCPMCMGAIVQARVARLVFGARDQKAGAAVSLYRIGEDPRLNHRLEVVPDVLGEACSEQLSSFFRGMRERKRDAER